MLRILQLLTTGLRNIILLNNKGANMTKEYIIYTKKIAYQLRKCGFKIIRTGINENYPQFNTYIFEDTEELRIALQKITKQ